MKQAARYTHRYTLQWTEHYSPQDLGDFQRVVWGRTDAMTDFTHILDTADKLSRHVAYQASTVYRIWREADRGRRGEGMYGINRIRDPSR